MNQEIIYLDNNSTTRIDPRVLEAMMPFLTEEYANVSSRHKFGTKINERIKLARNHVADLINCNPQEVFFTSGATESNNLALKGLVENYKNKGKHIVTVETEHSAVLDTCKYLEDIGYEVSYLPVKQDGLLDIKLLEKSIRQDTVLVSIMFVNNETGVIQPIKKIAKIAHSKGAFFMTDATQGIGKIPIDVRELEIDLLSLSGHKFYAPKGIGALYVKSNNHFNVKLTPNMHGGGHEKGLRSGTLNVPGIIGLGKASEIALNEIVNEQKKITLLRDRLEKNLLQIENTFLNGNFGERLYNTSNICFKGADAELIIAKLENIIVSNGAACTSNLMQPSHVLKSMGLNDEESFSSIRFSLGRFNTIEEVDITVMEVKKIISQLRAMA